MSVRRYGAKASVARSALGAAAIIGLALLAGCTDSTTITLPPVTTQAPDSPYNQDRKTGVPEGEAVGISLTKITVRRNGDTDRVEYQFTGDAIPGWTVQYVSQPVQNGTNQPFPVAGRWILEVLIREAPNPFGTTAPPYSGPDTLTSPEAKSIAEVRYSTVDRQVTQSFIGLNADQPVFRVTSLENPTRIIVDIGA
ncbi:AMIN-like domain-containing (lipo)protein [Antrihabitans spumae]|uniref:AMIN-like domain-containing protein n=1 Tax=Antrihabitans spumae TaxID=3373370 RepID=A0ABW7KCB5_9NOCA